MADNYAVLKFKDESKMQLISMLSLLSMQKGVLLIDVINANDASINSYKNAKEPWLKDIAKDLIIRKREYIEVCKKAHEIVYGKPIDTSNEEAFFTQTKTDLIWLAKVKLYDTVETPTLNFDLSHGYFSVPANGKQSVELALRGYDLAVDQIRTYVEEYKSILAFHSHAATKHEVLLPSGDFAQISQGEVEYHSAMTDKFAKTLVVLNDYIKRIRLMKEEAQKTLNEQEENKQETLLKNRKSNPFDFASEPAEE